MELKSPYGHTLLTTVGGRLKTAGVRSSDEVIVDILVGRVMDLSKSPARSLSFNREDVIHSEDFGELRRGTRVPMETGTAEVQSSRIKTTNSAYGNPSAGSTTSTFALGSTAIRSTTSRWVISLVFDRFNPLRSGFGRPANQPS